LFSSFLIIVWMSFLSRRVSVSEVGKFEYALAAAQKEQQFLTLLELAEAELLRVLDALVVGVAIVVDAFQ